MDSINIRNTRNKRERRERSSLFSILHCWKRRGDPGSWPGQKRRTPFFDRSLSASKPRTTSYPFTAPRLFRLIARSLASHQSRPARLGSRRRPPRVGRDLNSRVIQRGRPSPPFRSRGRSLSVTPAYGRYATPSSSACRPRDPAPRARDAIPRLAPRSPRASVAIVARAAPRARKKTTVRETKQLRYLTRTSPISTGPRLPWPP